jgi:hypothetical protein
MDNVNLPSDDEKDIIMADEVCRAFEETSNTILNRNEIIDSWPGSPGRGRGGINCCVKLLNYKTQNPTFDYPPPP